MTGSPGSRAPIPPSLVMVVDDDSDTRSVIRQALLVLGHHIIEAEDGEVAQKRCEEQLPDVIILDLMMPRVTGLEFLKWFRGAVQEPYVPVLMLTALADVEHKVEGLSSGADEYLVKPFNYKELQARVQALLRIRVLTNDLYRHARELEEANTRLSAMQEALVAKERELVAVQMAGTAAHNLGQPLTTVLLHCRVLEQGLSPLLPSLTGKNREAADGALRAAEAITKECQTMREVVTKLRATHADSVTDYVGGVKILDIDK